MPSERSSFIAVSFYSPKNSKGSREGASLWTVGFVELKTQRGVAGMSPKIYLHDYFFDAIFPLIDSFLGRLEPIQKHSRYDSRPSFRLAISSATHTEQSVERGKPLLGRTIKPRGSGSGKWREDQVLVPVEKKARCL